MKVLVLTQDLRGGGGAEKFIANLTMALGESVDFVLLCPKMNMDGNHHFTYRGRTVRVEMKWNEVAQNAAQRTKRFFYRLAKLRRIIRNENPDIIFSNFSLVWHLLISLLKFTGLIDKPVALRFGNPISLDLIKRGPLYRLLMFLGIRCINRVIVNSTGLASDVAKTLGVTTNKIAVINNPVLINEIEDLSREKIDFPLRTNLPVILTVGRLSSEKNQALLIRAFQEVQKHVNSNLVILGIGPEEVKLRKLVNSLGLTEKVHFLGWQSNPFKYMNRATVFVLSSDYEGFPSVLVEAMACGCPVVSTDCSYGPAEILDGGKYGILVPVRDEGILSMGILQVLRDESLRTLLSNIGMERAKDFDATRIAYQYNNLFNELAIRPGPSRVQLIK
jgi:glycosyltransferase involved in cell wall biosynthesis